MRLGQLLRLQTPYLSTASPPPPSLVDPNLSLEHPTQTVYRAKNPRPSAQTQQAKNQDANAVAGPSTRLRRPATGEIPLYATSIEIDSQSSRDDEHGWKEVGDEISAPPMGVDAHVRAAAWSPSGCSDLGGCLLAVMLNTGQVTIWGPRSDPMSKQWDELADLTGQLAQIAVEEGLETMTVRRMLQMRSTCMEWAPPIPLSCRDQALSMLAVGNRAGEIHIWASSRARQFTRLLVVPVGQTWVTHVTWASDWRAAGRTGAQEEWTTELLCALADGSTHRVTVRLTRTAQGGSGVRHTDIHIVSGPDKCPVTALASTPDVLIWTKASTVYIHAAGSGSRARWRGLKTIRLSRVGNWAGANPFNPCVGIQVLSHNRLVVVLSSLTHHIIENLLTEPTLADPVESLRASLAARDVLLDFFHNESTKKDRLRMSADNDRDVTAHTIGWEAISTDGAIVSSVSEPINFHNLDAATEGHRFLLFSITDMSASLAPSARGSLGPTEELAAILADPPCLLDVAPQRILLPILARAVGAPQTEAVAEEMLGLCQVAPRLPAVPNGKVAIGDLLSYMWSSRAMDASRLRVVIAQWCSVRPDWHCSYTTLIRLRKRSAMFVPQEQSVCIASCKTTSTWCC